MGFRLCLAFLAMIAVLSAGAAGAAAGDGGSLATEQRQNGSTGQWPSSLGDDEWALPSENARRFLQSGGYLTYGAMNKNKPAAGSGKSGQPYTPGCSATYNCRSS